MKGEINMFFSGDYEVTKKRTAFVISVIGEENSVRITEKEVEAVCVEEDPEMIAILLGIIEFARIDEKALKNKPKHLIHDRDVLSMIKFLLECKMITIDALINKISDMKYFEMKNFFEGDFEEESEEEVESW